MKRAPAIALLASALLGCPSTTHDQSVPPGLPTAALPAEHRGRRNPFSPQDAAALEQGRRLYHQPFTGLSCAGCHGTLGNGRGPAWAYIEPGPPSFASPAMLEAFEKHADYVSFWVDDGLERTPMPAFGDVMSEQEIWQAITYAWYLGLELKRNPPREPPGQKP
jgi:mono/diheme cytochrome c family protein